MTTIPINDITPKNAYIATAGQTIFPYTYFVNQEGDLRVYVNEVLQVGGYTVTNLQTATGGNVVFDVGLNDGDIVVLARCSIIERLSEFEASGAFFASAVNLEYTYGVVIDQDLKRKVDDALKLADFETETVKMNLPSVDGNDGNLLRLVLDTDTGEYCWIFASPSEIFTASLPNGTPGTILGYQTNGEVGEYSAGPGVVIDDATQTISAVNPGTEIQEEGASLGSFTTLNFIGATVTAADGGGGVATITVTPSASSGIIVSGNDTTPGNLIDKLTAGQGIALTEINDGADEDLEISVPDNSVTLDMLEDDIANADLFIGYDGAGNVVAKPGGSGSVAGTVEVFTASGTWTKPVGYTGKVKITITGAGGGGGNASTNGGTGGTSSFGAFASATGGTGGLDAGNSGQANNAGGNGGVGIGGTININGGEGHFGDSVDDSGPQEAYFGGNGGSSYWGGGGRQERNGTAYGSGGGGISQGTVSGGGGGAGGTAILWEDADNLGATETVTIGNGGSSSGAGNGRAGVVIVEYLT